MCFYVVSPVYRPLVKRSINTKSRRPNALTIWFLSKCFPTISEVTLNSRIRIQWLKTSFPNSNTWVSYLTKFRRRLIAYSWLQTHSQGSKPPSAISARPWNERKRLWGTQIRVTKWENATCWQFFAQWLLHRYAHEKGRRLLIREQSAASEKKLLWLLFQKGELAQVLLCKDVARLLKIYLWGQFRIYWCLKKTSVLMTDEHFYRWVLSSSSHRKTNKVDAMQEPDFSTDQASGDWQSRDCFKK